MTNINLLQQIEAFLNFNTEPSKEEISKLRKSIQDHLTKKTTIDDVPLKKEELANFLKWYYENDEFPHLVTYESVAERYLSR